MYVVYKPVLVNQGDQQGTQGSGMVQFQPVQISNSQMNALEGQQQRNIDSTCIRVPLVQGLQGQQILETQGIIQNSNIIPNLSLNHGQHLFTNQFQPAVQGQTILQLRQQMSQMHPSLQGKSDSTHLLHFQSDVNPVKSEPIQWEGGKDKSLTQETEDKHAVSISENSRIGETYIKSEVIDPDYEFADNGNHTTSCDKFQDQAQLTSAQNMKDNIYPVSLIVNKNNVSTDYDTLISPDSKDLVDFGTSIKKEPANTVQVSAPSESLYFNSKDATENTEKNPVKLQEEKLDTLITGSLSKKIWDHWASSTYDKRLKRTMPCFHELCAKIENKAHFLVLLKRFIYEIRDCNGKLFSWKTMDRIICGLEDALKVAYQWKGNINLIETAEIAMLIRDVYVKGRDGNQALGYDTVVKCLPQNLYENIEIRENKFVVGKSSPGEGKSSTPCYSSSNSQTMPTSLSTNSIGSPPLTSLSSSAIQNQLLHIPLVQNQPLSVIQNPAMSAVVQNAAFPSLSLVSCFPEVSIASTSEPSNLLITNKRSSIDQHGGETVNKTKITSKPLKRFNFDLTTDSEIPPKKFKENIMTVQNVSVDNSDQSNESINVVSTEKQEKDEKKMDKKAVPRFQFIDNNVINSTIAVEKSNMESSNNQTKSSSGQGDALPGMPEKNSELPGNTLKNNNWATNTWNDWAKERNKLQIGPRVRYLQDLNEHNITECELSDLLKKFVFEARNNAGQPYPPTSLRNMVAGFQRILRQNGWVNLSILDSSQQNFKEFRQAMEARCNELLKQGIGTTKKQAEMITEQQELTLWDKEVFSLDTGWGLVYAVYFYTCKVFCVASAYELWKLKQNQFTFGEDDVGKYVEFRSTFNTVSCKNKCVKQYKCDNNPRTYYNLLAKYMSLIPKVEMFFVRPDERQQFKFSRSSIGKSSLDSFISNMMKKGGYKGYYTNHSVKASMATKMFKQGFQENFIQERTGQVSSAIKKYNSRVSSAEAVRVNISSTLDPPAPKNIDPQVIVQSDVPLMFNIVGENLQKSAEEKNKRQNEIVQELENQTKTYEDVQASSQISQQEIEILQREKEKQNKEILILKKTVDEMELRIETQKQTLCARDESMKKLLEMLQSKGLSVQKIEENQLEVEQLQTRQLEDDRKIKQLQNSLSQKETESAKMKEENSKLSDELDQSKLQLKQQPSSTHTMQAILEAKDSRISSLEKEVQNLEDRLITLQEEGNVHYDRNKDSISSREKTLKAELDLYKKETSRKDKEILALQMKKETLENQQSEHQQYIQVLKEQITAKEQQVTMIQGDLEDLRDRVKDKDSTIDRKSQKSHSLQSEKRKIETEVTELKEQMEMKDRRIANLQTQIESIESQLEEKEQQLKEAKAKLECQDLDNKILALEESLAEKEKQIEKLKEQKAQSEKEHQEELDTYTNGNQDLKTRIDTLQLELNEKQTELVELREQATEAQSVKFGADSKIRQLESNLSEKTAEIEKLTKQMEEMKSSAPELKKVEELQKQVVELTSQVEEAWNDANKAQVEVDRLLAIMKESENEKNEKENQIKELQEQIKEYRQKVGTLKRKQSLEKKNSATMLEEARKREDSLYDDASELENTMKSKNDRIEELEEALKESVKITAEREMVMLDLQTQLDEAEKKSDELTMDLVKSKTENGGKVDKLNKILEEKEVRLKKLHAERHKHLEEVFEMKQEAILAAMSEKDANIALLEMTSSKKQKMTEEIEKLNKEKEKLQQQLSEVTNNRMKLIQKLERREERKKSSLPRKKKDSASEKSETQSEAEQPLPIAAPPES